MLVAVDHLTRMAHFTPCRSGITTKQAAELFVKEVIRLHGVPQVLVSDRDPLFTADFWASLWQMLGTRLNMSTARRPQTVGLSERSNETMQQLLRCYACEIDNQWVDALPMVEFCFNNAVNEALRMSPFEANYGFKPLTPLDVVLPYTPFALSADAKKRVKLLKDTRVC